VAFLPDNIFAKYPGCFAARFLLTSDSPFNQPLARAMHIVITVGMERPLCRAFIGLKAIHMLATSKNLNGSNDMFRNAFLTTLVVASMALFGTSDARAQFGYSHQGSHGNSHGNLHQDLGHNEFHRQQYHAYQHQFRQTPYQHFQLHQDLNHDRYHDDLSHRSYHSYRPSYNTYPQYNSGFGQGFPSYGFSLRIGR